MNKTYHSINREALLDILFANKQNISGVNPVVDEFAQDYGYDLNITEEFTGIYRNKK